MQSHLSRRSLLTTGAVGLASLWVAPQGWAAELSSKPVYSGPNIFLIRFGGGVRRQETIDPDQTYAPFLRHTLAQRGTLFPQMELDQLKQVTTSHGEGTLHILTGKYGDFIRTDGFGDRLESRAPTLFEYLRKQYAIAEHQTLLINGEDRTSEEFYSFSNHHLFGVNYRCQVLSLYRFKIYLLQQQIEAGNLQGIELEKKIAELQHLEGLNYRQADRKGNSPEMSQFWKRWHQYYGSSGLVNPRGDRVLTELAIWAIQQLRPKFLMINYSDPDYVHWGYPSHYHNGIAIIDQGIKSIVQTLEADPEYRDNTVLCIVPDCGRDSNQFLTVPYQHHFGSRSAHEIFALFVGKGIRANQIVDLRVSQVDVAPTLAHLMGCQAEYAEGSVLEEVFA
jgi:hypothetical protein